MWVWVGWGMRQFSAFAKQKRRVRNNTLFSKHINSTTNNNIFMRPCEYRPVCACGTFSVPVLSFEVKSLKSPV